MMDSKIPQSKTAIKAEIRKVNGNLKSFGGKLKDFKDNQERHFNQRMLKAYLRGDSQFQFGKSWKKNQIGLLELLPDWYNVQLTDKTVNPKQIDALLANGYCDPGNVFGGVRIGKSKLREKIFKRQKEARELKEHNNKKNQKSVKRKLSL